MTPLHNWRNPFNIKEKKIDINMSNFEKNQDHQ